MGVWGRDDDDAFWARHVEDIDEQEKRLREEFFDCEPASGLIDVDPKGTVENAASTKEASEQVVRSLGRGWNCVVLVQICGRNFKVLLDSGASRNLVRTAFLKELKDLPGSQEFVKGPGPTDRIIGIAGIHANQTIGESNSVSKACDIRMRFLTGLHPNLKLSASSAEVQFGLMESSADDLVVGAPQLANWGFSLTEDHGVPSVVLFRLGVKLPMEKWYPNPQLNNPDLVTDRENFERFQKFPGATPKTERKVRSRQMYDDRDIDDY
jgi:hypothetical protein